MTHKELGEKLNRSEVAVRSKCKKVKIRKITSRRWTETEEDYLKESDGHISVKEQALHLDRTESSIQHKRKSLELTNRNLYTEKEINLIRELRPHYTLKDLSEIVDRTVPSLRQICYKRKIYGSRNLWSPKDELFLKENIETMTHKELALILDHSETAISTRAASKGWYRPSTSQKMKIYDDFIKENYQNMTCKEIAEELAESEQDIKLRIDALKLTKEIWTKEQIKILEDSYPTTRAEDISVLIDKTVSSIIHKANRLNLKIISRNNCWLPHEIDQLKKMTTEGYSRLYIATTTGKSDASVGKKQKKLGIFKYDDRYRIEYDGMIFDSKEERDCYIILRDC